MFKKRNNRLLNCSSFACLYAWDESKVSALAYEAILISLKVWWQRKKKLHIVMHYKNG